MILLWSEELQLRILREVRNDGLLHRVLAFDLETKILNKDDFLTNEIILGISVARRLSSNSIERKSFFLDKETSENEFKLLQQFSNLLKEWKPLLIVGYGVRYYDQPLLALKERKCRNHNVQVWGIKNVINGSIFIELANLSSYLLYKIYNEGRSYRKMIDVMNHKHFVDLPFIRTKEIYDTSFEDKGKGIYEDWKNKDEKFRDYLDAEAYNQLLIAERIRETKFRGV